MKSSVFKPTSKSDSSRESLQKNVLVPDVIMGLTKIEKELCPLCSALESVAKSLEYANQLLSMKHTLELIRKWAWRMSFNPDPQKKAVKLIFSRKKI